MSAPSADEWFNSMLNRYLTGDLPTYAMFQLGTFKGCQQWKPAEIMMPQHVAGKATTKHGIPSGTLLDLPSKLIDPAEVYNSKQAGSVVIRVNCQHDGEWIVATMKYMVHPDFDTIYLVTSLHPRRTHHFELWEREGLLLYRQKQEGQAPHKTQAATVASSK